MNGFDAGGGPSKPATEEENGGCRVWLSAAGPRRLVPLAVVLLAVLTAVLAVPGLLVLLLGRGGGGERDAPLAAARPAESAAVCGADSAVWPAKPVSGWLHHPQLLWWTMCVDSIQQLLVVLSTVEGISVPSDTPSQPLRCIVQVVRDLVLPQASQELLSAPLVLRGATVLRLQSATPVLRRVSMLPLSVGLSSSLRVEVDSIVIIGSDGPGADDDGAYECERGVRFDGGCVAETGCPARGTGFEACKALCSATAGCNAIVHNAHDECWLKKGGGPHTADEAEQETRSCVLQRYTCELDVNYLGACLSNTHHCPATATSLAACQALCDATTGCTAIVHNKYKGGSCFLKKEKGGHSLDAAEHETRGCASNLRSREWTAGYQAMPGFFFHVGISEIVLNRTVLALPCPPFVVATRTAQILGSTLNGFGWPKPLLGSDPAPWAYYREVSLVDTFGLSDASINLFDFFLTCSAWVDEVFPHGSDQALLSHLANTV